MGLITSIVRAFSFVSPSPAKHNCRPQRNINIFPSAPSARRLRLSAAFTPADAGERSAGQLSVSHRSALHTASTPRRLTPCSSCSSSLRLSRPSFHGILGSETGRLLPQCFCGNEAGRPPPQPVRLPPHPRACPRQTPPQAPALGFVLNGAISYFLQPHRGGGLLRAGGMGQAPASFAFGKAPSRPPASPPQRFRVRSM